MGWLARTKGSRWYLVIAVVTGIATVALVVYGVSGLVQRRPAHYVQVAGVVQEIHRAQDGVGVSGTTIRVMIKDQQQEFEDGYGFDSTRIGDQVPVFYDPDNVAETLGTDNERQDLYNGALMAALFIGIAGWFAFLGWRG